MRGLACEHALDWLLGEALGILELLDSHGGSELHISIDDWGAHIAGSIALHPSVLSEMEAIQFDTKEFHPANKQAHIRGYQRVLPLKIASTIMDINDLRQQSAACLGLCQR